MPSGNIPDDLQDDVRMLLPHEAEFVFRELQSKLSDQGIYTFCSLLTEDANAEPWTDISLVFKVLFLDKVCFVLEVLRYPFFLKVNMVLICDNSNTS